MDERVDRSSLQNFRGCFFSHAPAIAGGVYAFSTVAFLIPTIIFLSRLGKLQGNAQGDLNTAQMAYDSTQNQLNGINARIQEARKRVVDLTCAMAGTENFNEAFAKFYQSVNNSTASMFDRLGSIWQLHFDQDRVDSKQKVDYLSYQERYTVRKEDVACSTSSCGYNVECCTVVRYVDYYQTYYYSLFTNTLTYYKNILSGSGPFIPRLDCGYYTRKFEVLNPSTYITYTSPKMSIGNRRDGSVVESTTIEYGSQLSARYQLDDSNVNIPIVVPRASSQNEAGNFVASTLLQFAFTALTAFQKVGTNYQTLQNSISDSIPGLLSSAQSVSEQLNLNNIDLQNNKTSFGQVDANYQAGLSLWLPLFFLVPPVIAVITYFAIACSADACQSTANLEEAYASELTTARYDNSEDPDVPDNYVPPPPTAPDTVEEAVSGITPK